MQCTQIKEMKNVWKFKFNYLARFTNIFLPNPRNTLWSVLGDTKLQFIIQCGCKNDCLTKASLEQETNFGIIYLLY